VLIEALAPSPPSDGGGVLEFFRRSHMSLEAAQASVLARTPSERGTNHKPFRHMVDIVTVVLAIASIAFAYKQKLDSSDLKDKTEILLDSASTRYVAEFPHSIPVITNIVQGACSDLSVMIDVPGYGEYSSPQDFYSYMHSILDLRHRTVKDNLVAGRCIGKTLEKREDLARVPSVHLLMFSPDEREVSLRKQLTREALAKSLAETSGRDVFLNFFKSNPDLLGENPEEFLEKVKAGSGYEQFIGILLADLRDHEKELKKAGVEIRYTREPFIMRVWLQDAEQAAFSFDHSAETEIAFQTHDSKLLDNFKQIFQQQWDNSVCYSDYWNAKEKDPTITINGVKGCA
jgi:hypothetical protein